MFPFLSIGLPGVSGGSRTTGLTATLDKGLGPDAVADLLTVSGPWIDVVKIGWGLSRLHPREVLVRKLAHYQSAGVAACTGGTLLEVAYAQGVFEPVLEEAVALGFGLVEISNGVHPMSQRTKLSLIERATQAGVRVLSEVGRKDPEEDARIGLEERIDLVLSELAAGSEKVILEARESGTVGIFDRQGQPVVELLERMVERVGTERIIFEAPRKAQQLWLIRHFGPDVNLGNVPISEALPLASLRTGIRGDTFADMHIPGIPVWLELGVNGALAARRRGGVVIVIDALRASATIVAALGQGMRSVKLVPVAGECVGEVTAGERGGRKLSSVDHANSPSELLEHDYRGKQLVLTTTNGVECLLTAQGEGCHVLVGTTLNARAVAREALRVAGEQGCQISIVRAGRNHLEAPEDSIAAAEIIAAMGAEARVKGAVPPSSASIEADFFASDSGVNLVRLGYAKDVRFCAQLDRYDIVPVLRDGVLYPVGS